MNAPDARLTRLICTIGPASVGQLDALIAAGLDVARLNLSHGTDDERRRTVAAIRTSAKAAQASLDAAQTAVTDPAFKNGDALAKSIVAADGAVAAFAAITAQLPAKGGNP